MSGRQRRPPQRFEPAETRALTKTKAVPRKRKKSTATEEEIKLQTHEEQKAFKARKEKRRKQKPSYKMRAVMERSLEAAKPTLETGINVNFGLPPQIKDHRISIKIAHASDLKQGFNFDLPEELKSKIRSEKMPKFKKIARNIFFVDGERVRGRGLAVEKEDVEVCSCKTKDMRRAQEQRQLRAKGKHASEAGIEDSEDIEDAEDEDDDEDRHVKGCGMDCLNRLLQIQCSAHNCSYQDQVAGAKAKQGKVTEWCRNRVFTEKEERIVEPFPTSMKGWGLHARKAAKAGTFLHEYVGEVIDNKMCGERIRVLLKSGGVRSIKDLAARKPGSPKKQQGGKRKGQANGSKQQAAGKAGKREAGGAASGPFINLYFLTLGNDMVIDACHKGGVARFLNHSCDPNCVVEKWNVDGELRVGIFAKKNLAASEECTIDYQFDEIGDLQGQPCFCGEPCCAKVIGGQKRVVEQEKVKVKSKKKKKEDLKLLQELSSDQICNNCQESVSEVPGKTELVLCDGKVGSRFCPRCYHPGCIVNPDGTAASNGQGVLTGSWLCPYHFCDQEGCGKTSKVYCRYCSNSWCVPCFDKLKDLQKDDDGVAVQHAELPQHGSFGVRCRYIQCFECVAGGPLNPEISAAQLKEAEDCHKEMQRKKKTSPKKKGPSKSSSSSSRSVTKQGKRR